MTLFILHTFVEKGRIPDVDIYPNPSYDHHGRIQFTRPPGVTRPQRVTYPSCDSAAGPDRKGPPRASVFQRLKKVLHHQERNTGDSALKRRVKPQRAHQTTGEPVLEVDYHACTSPIPDVHWCNHVY